MVIGTVWHKADSGFPGLLGFQGTCEALAVAVEVPSLTPPSSTGSAGLIQTIQAFTKPSLPAAIVGTVATVGWVVQGVGLAYYYRQVGQCVFMPRFSIIHGASCATTDLGPSQRGWTLRREGMCGDVQGLRLTLCSFTILLSGKGGACFARREGVLHAWIDYTTGIISLCCMLCGQF